MKSKIGAAFAKAVATIKAEFWDGNDQPSSAQTAASAPAPRWEGDRWNSEVEYLHSKLSHVKEGLETALARVSYLEQSIYDKETSLEIEPDDRLMDANMLERGKRRDRALAERAKELWGEEDEGGRVIETVKIKVKTKEGAEDEFEETEEAGEGEESHHFENVPHERNNGESGNAQQQGRSRKTRRGTRAGAAVKGRTGANARDDGDERGRGGAVVGEGAGETRRQVQAMCDRAGPGSHVVLLKKLYPLILSWVCIGLFIWRLGQQQGDGYSAIEQTTGGLFCPPSRP